LAASAPTAKLASTLEHPAGDAIMNAKSALLASLVLVLFASRTDAADATKGYQAKVKVGAATRLDWTFAVANQSVDPAPANWLGDYESSKQNYELFVPADYTPKKAYPVVLFIAPGNEPGGWKAWEPICKKEGVIFASPYAAGNDVPGKRRARLVLDVLDDVRRNYSTDPDRTYITGFSGGGRIACAIGFALPELFGGVLPCCAAGELRDEVYLRQRVIDRLSVGFLTGDGDFNRGECERFRGPMLAEVGVRTKVWVAPKTGHAVAAGLLPEAFKWLEEGLPKRRELAKQFPASRIAGNAAPSRDDWAKLLLAEGKERLKEEKTVYSGLMLLKGCLERWPKAAASTEARKILLEYDAKPEKPWEEEDIYEQRRFMIATARGLSDYASGPLPPQYEKQRRDMIKEAVKLWAVLLKDGQDGKAVEEAKKRIPELLKLAEEKEK
jgi:predicted esterase